MNDVKVDYFLDADGFKSQTSMHISGREAMDRFVTVPSRVVDAVSEVKNIR